MKDNSLFNLKSLMLVLCLIKGVDCKFTYEIYISNTNFIIAYIPLAVFVTFITFLRYALDASVIYSHTCPICEFARFRIPKVLGLKIKNFETVY